MAFPSFPLMFLQASVTALVTCSAAWAFLQLARRRWPSLDARRTPWLLAQLAGAMTLVVVTLPASSRLSLFAAAPQPALAELAWHLPGNGVAGFQGGVDALSADAMLPVLPTLAWLWLACWFAGAAWHGWRWRRVQRDLRSLLSVADRLDGPALHAHPAFGRHQGALPPVLEVDAPVSPLLAGLFHPVLLLPRHMRALPPAQQGLIVAHELMHLRRRDHLWQHAGTLLQVFLWFVPPVRRLNEALQWALELGCDRAVLAGRPDSERRSYAAALLAQLAVQARAAGTPPAALAFGARNVCGVQAVAERIRLIRDAQPLSYIGFASVTALLLPALCGASVLLQPQFAWSETAEALSTARADYITQPGAAWQAPLATLRVTGEFGSTNRPGGKPHKGMDFGAPRGTAVVAPADGRVAVSTDRYDGGARYGKVVVIEHASGTRTLYAHLDGRMVQAGDIVRAGQQIALSGATGKVTGPHLHFEVSRGGAHIDPQAVLGGALAPPQR
ncbi:M23/M56 family metallopeptidase [Massilia niabensis]|uniref:M23/M56 family metallopeptidase n=1 Tax=Massilia niabensis TaxID=544910 RepID=A0ABW0LA63_9BURK